MTYAHETIFALQRSSPAQAGFQQAVDETPGSLRALLRTQETYPRHPIIERIVEPERQIMFLVR